MKKVLLDTNAYTALMRNEPQVVAVLGKAEEIFVPVIVLGELFFGFAKGNRNKENLNLLNDFLSLPGVSILNTSIETAEIFAQILLALRKKGKPIPTNDIWIAALAVETGALVISFDTHMSYIDQIRLWDGNK
ncbi:MAG: type II toxin-antitoxin system VapC family toxin [Bacteroidetes bacterium]|nr:MAG: type II toxin-antitoxin system VapC family toxin [Bacteroidota bacterium]